MAMFTGIPRETEEISAVIVHCIVERQCISSFSAPMLVLAAIVDLHFQRAHLARRFDILGIDRTRTPARLSGSLWPRDNPRRIYPR